MRIGVLALQGAFAEHIARLSSLGAETFEIRKAADLQEPCYVLVIPGGESTTMTKLLHDLGRLELLRERDVSGLPFRGP